MMVGDYAFLLTPMSAWRVQSESRRQSSSFSREVCTREPPASTVHGLHFPASKIVASQGASTSGSSPINPALLVVDHGSKRTAANEMLSDITTMLRARSKIPVYMAHMELASPTIPDGIDACVRGGASHVIVLPFFLSPGKHTMMDIPEIAAAAAAKYPNVTHEVRPPIGTHPNVVDILLDRAGLL